MNLSISNIAWIKENDSAVYKLMQNYGFVGLEIAPTRIIPDNPYQNLTMIKRWKEELYSSYRFVVSSIQSIWFGNNKNIFFSEEERNSLTNYTKNAIDFASIIGCKNLVFGCPKNRKIPKKLDNSEVERISSAFFKEIGDYAFLKNTCIGLEANPTIYDTNFINTTQSALDLIKRVNSKGFKLNLDIGTMIQNEESVDIIKENVKFINHVHISEPFLRIIEKRNLHTEILVHLRNENYNGFISIEMGMIENLTTIETVMKYISSLSNGVKYE